MKISKTLPILLAILLLGILVSCSSEGVVDDAFTVTVSFNGNGATSGDMAAQKVGRGSDTRLEANAFERTFYSFTGWNTAPDGSGTAYTDRQSISTKENITLYAQWELNSVVLTSSTKYWTDGNVYVLNSDVTINDWVTVTGNAALILTDGNTLTVSYGVYVSDGNTLTIDAQGEGTGRLIANGNNGHAGIGGEIDIDCGTVIINGGYIIATGGYNAAGIGGGQNGYGGEITINGGNVHATGSDSAGIGGGKNGDGGVITINEGTVTASGGFYAAGIGGGQSGDGGEITINDGTVTATGGVYAAGIGGGQSGDGGVITINGGTVLAMGDHSEAGIGGGVGGDDGTLNLGTGVSLKVSTDSSNWSDYDGLTRRQYMKTV